MRSECFVIEGVITGFFSSPRVLELQVFADGTISGSVLETSENSDKFMLLHGTAVRNNVNNVYDVQFQIAKDGMHGAHGRMLHGLVRLGEIEGTLSRVSGLGSESSDATSTHGVHLPMRQEEERLADAAKPPVQLMGILVPGIYTLQGAAIGDNTYLYPATWTLSLLEGGVLEGSSTEERQVSSVEGSWTSTSVRFTLQYGPSKKYVYDGDAYAAALRGQWENADRTHRSTTEYGTFDFVVVDVRRQWSPNSHKYYPKSFRDAVRLCVLSSVQLSKAPGASPRFPSHLWSEVFSFCDVDWFPVPVDHLGSAPLSSTLAGGVVKMIKWAFPSAALPRRLRRAAATRGHYC